MSYSYIDEKYIRMLSPYLKRFREVGNGTYNCRCWFCGDSAKSEFKARGYFYQNDKDIWKYKCHNCAINLSITKVIKEVAPSLYEDYLFEAFGKRPRKNKTDKEIEIDYTALSKLDIQKQILSNKVLNSLTKVATLPEDSDGHKYLKDRSIPLDRMNQLYYTENLRNVVSNISSYDSSRVPEIKGIIIPYFKDSILTCFQVRNIDPSSKMRYLTYDLFDDAVHIYNLENIKPNAPVYVFEGAFDSMFCYNGCAASGSSIFQKLATIKKINQNIVVVFDNDYKTNKDIKKLLIEVIDNGYSVVLFDSKMNGYKDINQYAKTLKKNRSEITEYLQKCTYSNLSAKMHLAAQTKNRGNIEWAEETKSSTHHKKRQKTNESSQWAERKNSPFAI